jgi:hypothetical protein
MFWVKKERRWMKINGVNCRYFFFFFDLVHVNLIKE